MRPPCRHCGRKPTNRPRGLCFRCFRLFRDLYESGAARRGIGLAAPVRPFGRPTAARPGTEEKMRTLTARLEAREPLWHPADAGTGDA
jgi:hypothetical protein